MRMTPLGLMVLRYWARLPEVNVGCVKSSDSNEKPTEASEKGYPSWSGCTVTVNGVETAAVGDPVDAMA
jgi:hypothetical protein